jgi:hypothetical protein
MKYSNTFNKRLDFSAADIIKLWTDDIGQITILDNTGGEHLTKIPNHILKTTFPKRRKQQSHTDIYIRYGQDRNI